MERLIEDKTRGGAIFSVPDNNFFVRFVSRGRKEIRERERGVRRALQILKMYNSRPLATKADPFLFSRWRNAGHASASCLGKIGPSPTRPPYPHVFASIERKIWLYSLFVPEMSCCSLAAGSCRNDCSKVYAFPSPLLFLPFLANDTHASRPSSPPFLSIKLYVALKIPVGMRKREFSRNIISSAISPHRCLINIGWPDPVPR